MVDNKKEVAKRKEKIIGWLKDPYFLGLLGILLLAFIIRIYYFTKTLDQAVWWDEGEYMLRVKHLVLNTPQSGFFEGRELFTPYFWALIYYLFNSETAIRFVQVIISTLTVWATYYLGKEVYDKKIGLLASAFMTFFWLHLFFTDRLLTYLYAPLFYTLALGLFWAGYNKNYEKKDKYLLLFFVTVMLGVGIYYSIAFSALTVIIYLLFTERLNFVKNKRLWKGLLIALPLLLLSFIPSYIVQGSIIPRLSQVGEIESTQTGAGLAGLFTYVDMMPRLMLSVYLGILVISLYLFVRLILFFDIEIIKAKDMNDSKRDLFVFIGALVPFALYTWLSMTAGGDAGASYDAWIMPVFPALFCFMSRAVFDFTEFIKSFLKSDGLKKMAIIIVALIVIWGFYQHYVFAGDTIENKIPSYYNLKPAGEWLKENTAKEDKIYSAAVPELTYYSEREIMNTENLKEGTQEAFIELLKENNINYMVLTLWERSPDLVYSLPQSGKLNMTITQVYFLDKQMTNPDVIIYKINW
jgi:4-amino-4-deoxy-L-arabinose transferase-like glycosyltransferase